MDRVVRCRIAPAGLFRLRGADRGGSLVPLESLRDREVVAVTSLADPRPFVEHLERAGATVELIPFPDHHDFTPDESQLLARRSGARPLVMTRKEAVKLRELLPEGVEGWMVDQQVIIESNGEALDEALRRTVGL